MANCTTILLWRRPPWNRHFLPPRFPHLHVQLGCYYDLYDTGAVSKHLHDISFLKFKLFSFVPFLPLMAILAFVGNRNYVQNTSYLLRGQFLFLMIFISFVLFYGGGGRHQWPFKHLLGRKIMFKIQVTYMDDSLNIFPLVLFLFVFWPPMAI